MSINVILKMSIYYKKKKLFQNFSWYIFSIVENPVIFLACDTIPMLMRNSCFYLFIWIFRPNREFFTLTRASPLPGKGFKFWPKLDTESQLAVTVLLRVNIYCDTGHPFKMVISEDPWHSHLLPSVKQWSCPYFLIRLKSDAAGIPTPNLPREVPKL